MYVALKLYVAENCGLDWGSHALGRATKACARDFDILIIDGHEYRYGITHSHLTEGHKMVYQMKS